MPTAVRDKRRPPKNGLALLNNGDRMSQPEFHSRYELYPKEVKFGMVRRCSQHSPSVGEHTAQMSHIRVHLSSAPASVSLRVGIEG